MAYESNSIFWIEVEKIVPNPFQPRREFDQAKLQELSESIRMYGVLQPLVVTRREIVGENGAFSTQYELIAGERRLRASRLAGLAQVPVIIRSGEESELMKLELAIIENLQREDLNAVDRAQAFKQLAEQFGLSHMQVAMKVGRSREYVANSIRLLMLPDTILNALRSGDISDGHARTLLMLNDRPVEQDVVFREIVIKKLSVREVERISRKIATEKVRKKNWQDTDPELIEIEKQFTQTFGTRVQIQKTDFGGKLTIDYFASDDLRKLLEIIHKAESTVYGGTETKMLAHIASAVPLSPVSESEKILDVASPEPAPEIIGHEFVEEYIQPESKIPSYEEDVYTRHDTIEVPETPEAVFAAEEALVGTPYETFDEGGVVESVLDKIAEAHEVVPATETPVAPQYVAPVEPTIPQPTSLYIPHTESIIEPIIPQPVPMPVTVTSEPTPAPVTPVVSAPIQEDDTDLYAIKNFSL